METYKVRRWHMNRREFIKGLVVSSVSFGALVVGVDLKPKSGITFDKVNDTWEGTFKEDRWVSQTTNDILDDMASGMNIIRRKAYEPTGVLHYNWRKKYYENTTMVFTWLSYVVSLFHMRSRRISIVGRRQRYRLSRLQSLS